MKSIKNWSEFEHRVATTFGEAGAHWLDNLPHLIEECETQWQLRMEAPYDFLSFNYVAPATFADGREVVVKLGVPGHELDSEVAALQAYDGRGIARLIASDPQHGILILEKLSPGRMLAELSLENDEEATRIAARIMKRLWRPLPAGHPFPTVADWAKGFAELRRHGGLISDSLIDEAEEIFARHLETAGPDVLLHGDLHHYNILSAEREPWLAIDPKGLAGDPAYEAGALLRNPFLEIFDWPDLVQIQARRLDILAEELQIDRRRIQDWAVAQGVLSAWWSFLTDGQIDQRWLELAESVHQA